MKAIVEKLKQHAENLNEEQAAYVLFVVFLLLSVLLAKFNREYATGSLIISTLFLCYGFFSCLQPRLQRIWESFIGKILVSALLFIGSTFSISLAKISINATFQVPASPFVHTQALLSALLAPLAASILLGIASIILMPILTPLLFSKNETFSVKQLLIFWKRDGYIPKNICIILIRFFVFFVFITIFFNFSSNNGWYTDKIMKFSKWYAYNFETELFSYCKIEKNERIAYIGDNNIIIATKANGDILFKTEKCIEK